MKSACHPLRTNPSSKSILPQALLQEKSNRLIREADRREKLPCCLKPERITSLKEKETHKREELPEREKKIHLKEKERISHMSRIEDKPISTIR